jgi:hypothetical protein
MRRALLVLLIGVLGAAAVVTQAQAAAPAPAPAHRHVRIIGMQGPEAAALVARLSAISPAPTATNPCLGLGLFCLFQNGNGGGDILGFNDAALRAPGAINLTNFACGGCTNGIHGNDGTWNDQMSSWGNDTGQTYCWWVDINRGGTGHIVHSLGGTIQNLLPNENDTASSIDTPTSACH